MNNILPTFFTFLARFGKNIWRCPLNSAKIIASIVEVGAARATPYLIKVKVTLVQALRLFTGRTAHRGSRGIALLFHDYGTRRGWGVSVTPWPLFTAGKDPVLIVREAGWAPGPVWIGAENLAPPTGIRSPDRPVRSQSLYRLSYPAQLKTEYLNQYYLWSNRRYKWLTKSATRTVHEVPVTRPAGF